MNQLNRTAANNFAITDKPAEQTQRLIDANALVKTLIWNDKFKCFSMTTEDMIKMVNQTETIKPRKSLYTIKNNTFTYQPFLYIRRRVAVIRIGYDGEEDQIYVFEKKHYNQVWVPISQIFSNELRLYSSLSYAVNAMCRKYHLIKYEGENSVYNTFRFIIMMEQLIEI